MQIEIKIEDSCKEPKVIILTASMTEEVNSIIKKLSEDVPQIISGIKNEKIEVLEQSDLIRVYASSGKVFAVTDNGEYTLRIRLYEIEERLNPFVGAVATTLEYGKQERNHKHRTASQPVLPTP